MTVGEALNNLEGFIDYTFSRAADLLVGPQNGVVTKFQPTLTKIGEFIDSIHVEIKVGKP